MLGTVREFSQECWTEVMNRVIGAVVFLDEPSAENLHWHGGLSALLDAGAVAVKTLSPFEVATKDQKKLLFISSCTREQLQSIREIIRTSNLTHCVIICTVCLDVVVSEISGANARDSNEIIPHKVLETVLVDWINKKQSAVEIVHVPIFAISPSPLLLLMPAFSDLIPSFQDSLLPEGTAPVDLYSLSEIERAEVRRLAGCLSSMFEMMNVKEDIYYMGNFSSLIAGVLEYNPICAARRKNCTRPASLIIVDRTLDLCPTTSHLSDCLLDKMLSVLPNFPGHSTDVAVDVSPLCEANMISVADDIQLSPGCMWHEDEVCVQTFEYTMNKTQKEVLFHLQHKLSAIDAQHSPGHSARVTPATLEKIITGAKGNYDVIEQHCGLLQQALAVTQCLKSPEHGVVELMQALQRQALQNVATSRDSTSVLHQISHLIRTHKDRRLPLRRLLSLAVYVYSLAGHDVAFNPAHEGGLLATLAAAVSEDTAGLFPDEDRSPGQCEGIARLVMHRLREVGAMRKALTKYGSVLKPSAGGSLEYKGVIQQLVEDLLNPERPEMPDLKHRTESIKDLLRSGFNMLMNTAKRKHPLDNPLVVLLIVGGTTAEECRSIRESVVASGTDARVVVASTKLTHPTNCTSDVILF